jgi:hypothetical protein
VDPRYAELDAVVSWQSLLGYLNFSEGKPDARFQKQLSEAYGWLTDGGETAPWTVFRPLLDEHLSRLHASGASAFRNVSQASAVIALVFDHALPAYRRHHADLLAHLSDAQLLQPFFVARVFEAVLLQGAPWDDLERIIRGTLAHLNDFVGYRPVALLETRPQGEPYEHERVRPIPLFLRGAGVARGRYHNLISQALELLGASDAQLLAAAHFDPRLLDELALDPRAYDHGHPANRRPNYVFGEWDPHHLDNHGRYRRFVVRQVVLDALLERAAQAEQGPNPIPADEALYEAAAVLSGTILMAAGISGSSPSAYDSTQTLEPRMKVVARCRDEYYAALLQRLGGTHGARLRQEAVALRQPFGAARQHLNQCLAQHRAAQLEQRRLTVLYADLGYPEASRAEAARIPVVSVRMLSAILGRLSSVQRLIHLGDLGAAARWLPEVEDLLRRGIACGALVDPWNILGFQGLFPLSPAREDSIQDPRVEELLHLVEQIFQLYARLLSEAAAAGQAGLVETVTPALKRLAAWWDRFATHEVSDVRRVHGGEAAASALHVANALRGWQERDEATADLGFWREHIERFRSPQAFALVVEALLRREDYRASMALLMSWLGQAEQVPLGEDAEHSFHALALRWMLALVQAPMWGEPAGAQAGFALVKKFLDYLEANAEDYWQVPTLEIETLPPPREVGEIADELYGAAYEDVTYRDTTGDDEEGAVADGESREAGFYLEQEGERIRKRLRFLSTVARLWQVAARRDRTLPPDPARTEVLGCWLQTARENRKRLLALMDGIHDYPIPKPIGTIESSMEYDRRRLLKEELLYAVVSTCLDTGLAGGALQGTQPDSGAPATGAPWEPAAVRLEQAMFRLDIAGGREALPEFLRQFRTEQLLMTTLADGGHPRQVLRVRTAQTVLRALGANLPRLGLLRETYQLLQTARAMEQAHRPEGRGMTEFNHLFQAAFQAVVEAVVESASLWGPEAPNDRQLAEMLERLSGPFLRLWVEHSRTLQLSTLETVRSPQEWQALLEFIRRYGNDLFHARFLTLANLRGILHRGVGDYLDYLRANPDPLRPIRLIDDLDQSVRREDAVRRLQVILSALVENYEEYKDYNTTATQSDYGENLWMLLELLRLKAAYERHAWQFRPLVMVHEVLARHGRSGTAVLWQEAFVHLTRQRAQQLLNELARLEQANGLRLRTVADRLQERFVKPLALDRLCALIGPALAEAQKPEGGPSFARLQEEMQAWTATPTGVGLDVPHWLRRLESEVQRVRAERSAIAGLAEKYFRIPRRLLTRAEVEEQLANWDRSLPADG